MHTTTKKIRAISFASVFLGSAVAALVLVTFMINTKGDALAERMQLIADEQAAEQQHIGLVATVRDTEESRELLAGAVFKDESDTIELLSLLDTVAAKQGVALDTKQLDERETEGPYNTLALAYTISGSDVAVMRMLKILETLPYHGHVTSLSIRRTEIANTGSTEMEADISLSLSIRKHD